MICRARCVRLPRLLSGPEAARPYLRWPGHAGQGGDPGPAPPAEGALTAGQRASLLPLGRPGALGSVLQGASPNSLGSVPGQTRDVAALAPGGLSATMAEVAGAATGGTAAPPRRGGRADRSPGQAEPQLGMRARPGRAGQAGHQGRGYDSPAHPKEGRSRACSSPWAGLGRGGWGPHAESAPTTCSSSADATFEVVLHHYVAHYDTERPHRGLRLCAPNPKPAVTVDEPTVVRRNDVLGGLIHEHRRAAA